MRPEPEAAAEAPSGGQSFVGRPAFVLGVKVMSLFSFCGGPLFWFDQLESNLGGAAAFGVCFAPIALLVFGALFLGDEPDGLSRWVVRLGILGGAVLALANGAALVMLGRGADSSDTGLVVFGCLLGFLATGLYLWLAHHFLGSSPSSA